MFAKCAYSWKQPAQAGEGAGQSREFLSGRQVYFAASPQRLAYELSFEDPAKFNHFFKKRQGLTPARFRREQHGKLG